MVDRPILFSGPMVRALLAGTKTQTRRLSAPVAAVHAQRIHTGDRLYVRESLLVQSNDQGFRWLGYAADGKDVWPQVAWYKERNSIPSIHMPRWASRLTLSVTDVRVERLQDCSAVDALAEGVSSTEHWRPKDVEGKPFEDKWWDDATFWANYPQLAYRELWEAINGHGSWDANPWVAAYTFTVHHQNIDQVQQ